MGFAKAAISLRMGMGLGLAGVAVATVPNTELLGIDLGAGQRRHEPRVDHRQLAPSGGGVTRATIMAAIAVVVSLVGTGALFYLLYRIMVNTRRK